MRTCFEDVPPDVLDVIVSTRKEAARYRSQRNKARQERDEARELALDLAAELEALKTDGGISDWTIRGLQAHVKACTENHPPVTDEQMGSALTAVAAELEALKAEIDK